MSVLLRESAIIVRQRGAEPGRFVRRVSRFFQAPGLSPCRPRLGATDPGDAHRAVAGAVVHSRGKTRAWSVFRSARRSWNVELTKSRNVRDRPGAALPDASPGSSGIMPSSHQPIHLRHHLRIREEAVVTRCTLRSRASPGPRGPDVPLERGLQGLRTPVMFTCERRQEGPTRECVLIGDHLSGTDQYQA